MYCIYITSNHDIQITTNCTKYQSKIPSTHTTNGSCLMQVSNYTLIFKVSATNCQPSYPKTYILITSQRLFAFILQEIN